MAGNPKPRSDVRRWAATFAAVLTATLVAYWPALRGGMLWDDAQHVTPAALRTLDGLRRIWLEPGATQQYYPLLHSAFWLEHRLWGDAVLGYHLVNVLLHALAACFAIAIARRLGLAGARLAGLVFALHPVCVEAVAWISEQKSTLSAVLYLAAMLVYLEFDSTRRRQRYALALGLFGMALAAKTVTATLPAALLVVLWWKRGRLDPRHDLLPLAPWFALAIPAGLATAWIEHTSIGARGADFSLTFLDRCLVAGRAVWFYFGKILWPADLIFSYPRWTLDAADWRQWLYLAAVAAAAAALVVLARRRRGPLAAFLLFGITLFPALGFFDVYPFRFSFVADHFQYLAGLGIIVPAVSVLAGAARPRWMRMPAACLLLLPLGGQTWSRSAVYRDSETLWRATLARNPASWLAHNNLCSLLLARPAQLAEAARECRAALALRPDFAEAHNNLATALARAGRMPEAVAEFQAALAARPDFVEARFNLANALAAMPGREPDAIAEYRAALRLRPSYVEAHLNLAGVLLRLPDGAAQAVEEDRAALRLDPGRAEAHNHLATALARMPGRVPEAIAEYQAALRVDPNSARAHNNLGSLLAEIPGRLPEAIAEYQAAVSANPDYAGAHYNLGVALARAGREAEAIAEFEAALRIDPGFSQARYNLAVLRARQGR